MIIFNEEKTSNFDEKFIKYYDKGYIIEADVEYLKHLHDIHNDLPFLSEKKMKVKKCNKHVCNLCDKEKYVVYITRAPNHGLVFKKLHRIIKLKQEAWLKSYDDTNTKLRKEAKNDFQKDFFKLMDNSVFGKTTQNARKHRDTRFVTTDKRRSYLVSEPNYHTTK